MASSLVLFSPSHSGHSESPKKGSATSGVAQGAGQQLSAATPAAGTESSAQSLMQLELEVGPQLGFGSHSLIYCIRYLFCMADCSFLFLLSCVYVCVCERETQREREIGHEK